MTPFWQYVVFTAICLAIGSGVWLLDRDTSRHIRARADLIEEYAMDGWSATLRDIHELPETDEVAA